MKVYEEREMLQTITRIDTQLKGLSADFKDHKNNNENMHNNIYKLIDVNFKELNGKVRKNGRSIAWLRGVGVGLIAFVGLVSLMFKIVQ